MLVDGATSFFLPFPHTTASFPPSPQAPPPPYRPTLPSSCRSRLSCPQAAPTLPSPLSLQRAAPAGACISLGFALSFNSQHILLKLFKLHPKPWPLQADKPHTSLQDLTRFKSRLQALLVICPAGPARAASRFDPSLASGSRCDWALRTRCSYQLEPSSPPNILIIYIYLFCVRRIEICCRSAAIDTASKLGRCPGTFDVVAAYVMLMVFGV